MGKHGDGGPTTAAKVARAAYRTGVAGVFGGLAGAALYLAALAPADTYAAPMGPVGPSVATPQAPATSTTAPATTSAAPVRKAPRTVAQKPLSTSKRVVPDATPTELGSTSVVDLGATPPSVLAATDYRRPAAQVNGKGDKVALAKCAAEALEEVPGDPNVRNWYRDLLLQQCIARYNG